jgi:hypothetical protein
LFKEKEAKRRKKRAVLSLQSLLPQAKTSCASPSGNFALAKFTRNHGAFLPFTDFLLSSKRCAP